MQAAFPKRHLFNDVVLCADGIVVVARQTVLAINDGPFLGKPPTHCVTLVTWTDTYRFRNGRVYETYAADGDTIDTAPASWCCCHRRVAPTDGADRVVSTRLSCRALSWRALHSRCAPEDREEMKSTLLAFAATLARPVARPRRRRRREVPRRDLRALPQPPLRPAGWLGDDQASLRLMVCFNLKYPPNSAEADAFLKNMVRTIEGPPMASGRRRAADHADEVHLPQFAELRDWASNRAPTRAARPSWYYREQWKPAVTETSEQLAVVDDVATAR